MRISVLGAGAWGTALALSATPRWPVLLWGRDAAQMAAMQRDRVNQRYLPGVGLATDLSLTANLSAALGHEIAREARPGAACGVLSGPSFAIEVARAQPTALVAASDDPRLAARMVQAFHSDALRVYSSADPVGVEVGGAVKNVLAIATGIADGLALGQNARAALITRGLAEITRLAVALGAQPQTLMGLSGLGDLVLTATGDLSRNRRVGLMLAAGAALPSILQQLVHVAEGVPTAPMVLQRARALRIEMPITESVVAVLDGRASPAQALQSLMAREARSEAG